MLNLNNVQNVNCFGESNGEISVGAIGGMSPYTFVLNGTVSQASGTFTGLTAGNYVVEVEDVNGCTQSLNVTISEPQLLSLVVANYKDVDCSGEPTGFIDVSVGGGVTPYTFSWTDGVQVIGNDEDIFNIGEGTYTLTVTDGNGCQSEITQEISTPDPLEGEIVSTNELCFEDGTGTASVNIQNGTPPYTFLWSNFDTSSTVLGLTAGPISVIVTDANNCELYLTDTIEGPPAAITINLVRINDVLCFGGDGGGIVTTISGGTPPYNITWNPGGFDTPDIEDLEAGNYTITVEDANGCTATRTFTVQEPPAIISSVSITQPTCFGNETGMALVGASGGNPPFVYEWNTNPVQNGALANNLAGDTSYIVKITDSRGCEVFDTAFVEYPEPISITTIPTSVSCLTQANGEVAVEVQGGNDPYTYQLNGAFQADSVFTGLDVGTYLVFVVDNNNCSASTEFEIDGASSLEIDLVGAGNDGIFISDELFTIIGEQVKLDVELTNFSGNNIVEYNWSPSSVDLDECVDPTVCSNPTISSGNTVWVSVEVIEDINGALCVLYDSLLINVSQEAREFIPNAFSPNKDANCINEHFELHILGAVNLDVRIFNRWGQEIFHNPNQTNGPIDPSTLTCDNPRNAWDGTYQGDPVPVGTYAYQIEVTYFDNTTKFLSGSVSVIR